MSSHEHTFIVLATIHATAIVCADCGANKPEGPPSQQEEEPAGNAESTLTLERELAR